MKPIRLTMRGFMTYKNLTTIDFTKLYDGKVFLISGATGSGKTTIFDAISFALFGDISRGLTKDDLRSDFLGKEDEPTFVELSFDLGGRTYRIKRLPHQFAKRTRPGVEIHPYAELFEIGPNGEERLLADKKGTVDMAIRDLVGLDAGDLKKVMLLPQGEFSSFLLSESKEKAKLLGEIFDTASYRRVQERLKDEALESKNRLALLDNNLSQERSRYDFLKDILDEDLILKHDFNTIDSKIGGEISKLEACKAASQKTRDNVSREKIEAIKKLERLRGENEEIRAYQALEEEEKSLEKEEGAYKKLEGDLDLAKRAYNLKAYYENLVSLEESQKRTGEEISSLKASLNGLDKEERLFKAQSEKKEEAERDLEGLKISLAGEEKKLSAFGDFEKLRGEYKKILDEKSKEEEGRKVLEKKRGDLLENRDRLLKISEEIQETNQKLQPLLEREGDLREKLVKLRADLSLAGLNEKKEKDLIGAKKDLEEGEKKIASLSRDYKRAKENEEDIKKNSFIKDLNESGVCPICGSIQAEKLPLKDTCDFYIEKITEDLFKARANFESLNKKIGDLEGEIDSKLPRTGDLEEEIGKAQALLEEDLEKSEKLSKALETLNDASRSLKAGGEKLEKEIESLQLAFENSRYSQEDFEKIEEAYLSQASSFEGENPEGLEGRVLDLRRAIDEKTSFIEAYEKKGRDLSDRRLKTTTALEREVERLQEISQDLEEKSRAFDEKIKEDFQDRTGYLTTLKSYRDLKEREEEIRAFFDRVSKTKTKLEALKKYKGRRPEDTEGLEEEIKKLEESEEDLNKKINSLSNDRENISMSRKNFKKMEGQYKELSGDGRILMRLSNVANGVSGKVSDFSKMDFESFALIYYFERVLKFANKRLLEMSQGQFTLHRVEGRDKQKKSGLDLDVFDVNTGKTRPASSLSGGESFLASLSLALGLSDEIGAEKGGVKIDTLFIDEGFGTLSDDYLQKAIDQIEKLSYEDKFVGLISHVDALKEAIDSKILVTYDREEGSKVEVVR